jgi:hypothetical protein
MTAWVVPLWTSSGGAGSYLHWGVIQISRTNAIIIVTMLVLFVLAIALPFPKPPRDDRGQR